MNSVYREIVRKIAPSLLKEKHKSWKYKRNRELFEHADMDERERIIAEWFRRSCDEDLDFANPQTFSQKVQWMKLYDQPELKGRLADKYEVRSFIAQKIGEEYLVPLLGVWDDEKSIDFDQMPKKFVLKATHGAGWNILVRDKMELDISVARASVRQWLSLDYAYQNGFEYHYSFCTPRVMAEVFIDDMDDLIDYKVFCFSGEPKFIEVIGGRSADPWSAFVDTDWNRVEWHTQTYPQRKALPNCPTCLDELLWCARTLSEGFAMVRVDLYVVHNHVMFGEMTFTPASGVAAWEPAWADKELGELIDLDLCARKSCECRAGS